MIYDETVRVVVVVVVKTADVAKRTVSVLVAAAYYSVVVTGVGVVELKDVAASVIDACAVVAAADDDAVVAVVSIDGEQAVEAPGRCSQVFYRATLTEDNCWRQTVVFGVAGDAATALGVSARHHHR